MPTTWRQHSVNIDIYRKQNVNVNIDGNSYYYAGGGAGGATTIVNAPTTSVDQSSSMTNTSVSLSHPSRTLAAVNAAA